MLPPRIRSTGVLSGLALVPAAIFTLILLRHYGAGSLEIAWYWVAFLFAITVPGTLVWRAIFGSRGSLLVDAAAGSGVGLLLQFGWWFLFVSLGAGPWLLAGSVVVYIPFLAVPRLRGHWRTAPSDHPLPPAIAWGLAGLYCFSLIFESNAFALRVPPSATSWYGDLYWHLGNAAELMHRAVPQDMRLAGEPFHYHWFSSAHAAAMALTTGLDLTRVFAQLWLPPVIALCIGLLAAILHRLTGKWWPGLVAGLLMVSTAQFMPGTATVSLGGAIYGFSPSQSYSAWVMLFVILVLVEIWLAQRVSAAAWVLLTVTLLFSAGAKASNLPVLICGLALGLVITLLRRRPWTRMGIPLGLSIASMLATLSLVSGGAAGTKIQLLSTFRRTALYVNTMDLSNEVQYFDRGPLLPGLLTLRGALAAACVLAALLGGLAWVLPGMRALNSDERTTGGWVLFGIGFAGLCAALLIDQDGTSQIYFFSGSVVAWYVLAAWGMSRLATLAQEEGVDVARLPVWLPTAVVSGVGGYLLWRTLNSILPGLSGVAVTIAGMVVPILVGAVIVRWRRDAGARSAAWLALSLAIVSAATLPGLVPNRLADFPPASANTVSTDEIAAALWIRENTVPDDVLATNVHCTGASQQQPCENNSFWISAFGQRAVLLEGWAYTNYAHLHHGDDSMVYSRQPHQDQDLYELNEAVFYQPTPQALDRIRDKGVDYLFAGNQRAETSPQLEDLAEVVFRNNAVTVYKLG